MAQREHHQQDLAEWQQRLQHLEDELRQSRKLCILKEKVGACLCQAFWACVEGYVQTWSHPCTLLILRLCRSGMNSCASRVQRWCVPAVPYKRRDRR